MVDFFTCFLGMLPLPSVYRTASTGGDFSGHAARLPAGEGYGQQGEQGRSYKDNRVNRNHTGDAVELVDDHRGEFAAHEPADKQA